MASLNNKVAIITGGSRGMGRDYCLRFSKEGATVAVVYRSNAAKADEVVAEIVAAGGKAKSFQCDIQCPKEIAKMVGNVADEFGGIDILVNNAGVYLITPLGETTEETWDSQMNTNLKGAFFCMQEVVPHMKKRGSGKIINVASYVTESGIPMSSAYCASKGGMKLLTMSAALELRPFNIQVNCLSPGCVLTDMNEGYRQDSGFQKMLQERFGGEDAWMSSEELTGAAVFLASSDSDSVVGANLIVDRGMAAY